MTSKGIGFDNSKSALDTVYIIAIVIVVAIVAIVIGLNIAKTQVPYSTKDCQTKAFAFNGQSTCTRYDRGIIFSSPAKVVCTINNLERQPGTFTVTYGFVIAGKPVDFTVPVDINSLSSTVKTYTYNGDIDTCTCRATPPTYQECENVIRYKSVSLWESLFG